MASTSTQGIQVVCCGLGRTGTASLTEALQELGYKSYHYMNDVSDAAIWAQFVEGKLTSKQLMDHISQEGFTATLENPTSDIYQDLLRLYPKAKFILTVRDNEQAFVKSWRLLFDTMVITEQKFSWRFPSFFGYIPLFSNLRTVRYFMGTTHLGLQPGELTHTWRNKANPDEFLAEQYRRHNQHVIEHVPKDQLLIFNVKEGWEPLCKFLGKPIPPKSKAFPFSKINNTESLRKLKRTFLCIVYGWVPFLVLSVAGIAAVGAHRKGESIATFRTNLSKPFKN